MNNLFADGPVFEKALVTKFLGVQFEELSDADAYEQGVFLTDSVQVLRTTSM